MRTAAQETAPQIAMRLCFKEAGGKDSIYVILVKGEYMQLSTFVCVFGISSGPAKLLLVPRYNCHQAGF